MERRREGGTGVKKKEKRKNQGSHFIKPEVGEGAFWRASASVAVFSNGPLRFSVVLKPNTLNHLTSDVAYRGSSTPGVRFNCTLAKTT